MKRVGKWYLEVRVLRDFVTGARAPVVVLYPPRGRALVLTSREVREGLYPPHLPKYLREYLKLLSRSLPFDSAS